MAMPSFESSLACTGITASVRNQILRGETASASGSDPVATVATRTFQGAEAASGEIDSAQPSGLAVSSVVGAGADPTSMPPPEFVVKKQSL